MRVSIRFCCAISLSTLTLVLGSQSPARAGDCDNDPSARFYDYYPHDQAIVLVREDCGSLPDCFESMADLVGTTTWTSNDGWVWNCREPSQTTPLLADVGPGEFGQFVCPDKSSGQHGHVTTRGSGRDSTVLSGTLYGSQIRDCAALDFIDIGLSGRQGGVQWVDGGDSSWSNVNLRGGPQTSGGDYISAWTDFCLTSGVKSVHYFFGSRIVGSGSPGDLSNAAFSSICSETWFFGGEILLDLDTAGVTRDNSVIALGLAADFRAFGTAIRGVMSAHVNEKAASGTDVDDDLEGVKFLTPSSGALHMHGGIISLASTITEDVSVTAISVDGDSVAHTPGIAYTLKPSGDGTGTRVRTSGNGVAESPFLWQSGSEPPLDDGLVSEDGKDLFVELDCQSDTCDDADPGDETHLLIYNEACCPTSRWFDAVTGGCRGETASGCESP